jgi:hypothetical protein
MLAHFNMDLTQSNNPRELSETCYYPPEHWSRFMVRYQPSRADRCQWRRNRDQPALGSRSSQAHCLHPEPSGSYEGGAVRCGLRADHLDSLVAHKYRWYRCQRYQGKESRSWATMIDEARVGTAVTGLLGHLRPNDRRLRRTSFLPGTFLRGLLWWSIAAMPQAAKTRRQLMVIHSLGLTAEEWAATRKDLEVTKDWFRPRNTKGDIGGPKAPDSINPKIKWAFGPEDPNYYDPLFWAAASWPDCAAGSHDPVRCN